MIGALVLTLLILFVKPPGRLPDLWTVAICVYSCAHFVLFAFVYHSIQLRGLTKAKADELETFATSSSKLKSQ